MVQLNADWRFLRQDAPDGAAPDLDDSAWQKVTLPHSFNGGDGEQPNYYRGPSWYRKSFEVQRLDPSRRLYAQFDAAATGADVFLNGQFVGSHKGGHAAFRVDLTPWLRNGRNVLAVRVSNAPDPGVTPLGGDFTVFGGLYRFVSLIETDLVHLDLKDDGGPGAYVRIDDLGSRAAKISVRVRVANDDDHDRAMPITVRVRKAGGTIVANAGASTSIAAHGSREQLIPIAIPAPHLWNGVRDPYLYRVEVALGRGGDSTTVPLGLRRFSFDPSRGFILNGRPYPLHGVNMMNSARPGRGTAVSDQEVDEDLAIIREMGATGVRFVHFQHPEEAYAAADRLGLVVWTEIGINGKVENTAAFKDNAVQQMRELIAQTRNHPSVVLWGIGNEVYDSSADVMTVLSEVNAAAKSADPDRPTTYAHCCQADDAPKAMMTDVVGFNRYFGWYPDQKGTLGAWAGRFHASHPERPFAISEYGAGASIAHQADAPGPPAPSSGWHPEQYQALYHERSWREIRDRPYIFGSFVWVAFDLASGGRNEGDRPGINDKGLVTYDRQVRKDAWFWYQANWSSAPMLHLTGKRFTQRTESRAEVKAYTNGDAATLFVNGRKVGAQAPRDHILLWPITLRPGENRISIVQRTSGGTLRDSAIWTLAAPPEMLKTPD